MAVKVLDGALMEIRTARRQLSCGERKHPIEPGERYENWSVPPGAEGNESPRWWHGRRHADEGRQFGYACDEADAYREHAARAAARES